MKDRAKLLRFIRLRRGLCEEVFDVKCAECRPLLAESARKLLRYKRSTRDQDILRTLATAWKELNAEKGRVIE